MYYKTSLTTRLHYSNEILIVGLGTKQYIVNDKKEIEDTVKILNFLLLEKTEKEIYDFLELNNINNSLLDKLLNKKLIIKNNINLYKKDLYLKNYLYLDTMFENVDKIFENMKKTTFLILGSGGIGNYMSYAINTYDVEKIILFDADVIEETNLNRQILFSYNDIGKYKVEVLRKGLKSRNKNNNIEIIKEFGNDFNIEELIKNIDNLFVILSADSVNSIGDVTKLCIKYKVPFLNIGYLNDISVIGPFYIPNITSCPFCNDYFKLNINDNYELFNMIEKINNNYSSPASFINNSFASAMAMMDLIIYMSEDYDKINSINKRIGIDNMNIKIVELENKLDLNCKYCSKR